MEISDIEDELKVIKEKNSDLVQKVQFWKMKAAQQENDKLDLMKENNDLRLKLSMLRNSSNSHAQSFDSALQATTEEALSHLVQASTAMARTIELTKSYMRDVEDLGTANPRWSSISTTPGKEKVHKVPPMIGGRSIQPFVSLRRVAINNFSSNTSRNSNQTRNVTDRVLPLPMNMLQDLYIPLRRIDASDLANYSQEADAEDNDDLSNDNIDEEIDESQRLSESEDSNNVTNQLEVLHEDTEPGDDSINQSRDAIIDPLEGPSWLLDVPRRKKRTRPTLEPDSTTELDNESVENSPPIRKAKTQLHTRYSTRHSRSRNSSPNMSVNQSLNLSRNQSPTPSRNQTPNLSRNQSTSHNDTRNQNRSQNNSSLNMSRSESSVQNQSSVLNEESLDGCQQMSLNRRDSPVCLQLPVDACDLECRAFTPTVRRRKRPTTPPHSISPTINNSNRSSPHTPERVLKVLVPKIKLEPEEHPFRGFDAPSPNGATDYRLLALENSRSTLNESTNHSLSSSGAGEGDGNTLPRSRRARKQVVYKEKPLNRKMRR